MVYCFFFSVCCSSKSAETAGGVVHHNYGYITYFILKVNCLALQMLILKFSLRSDHITLPVSLHFLTAYFLKYHLSYQDLFHLIISFPRG